MRSQQGCRDTEGPHPHLSLPHEVYLWKLSSSGRAGAGCRMLPATSHSSRGCHTVKDYGTQILNSVTAALLCPMLTQSRDAGQLFMHGEEEITPSPAACLECCQALFLLLHGRFLLLLHSSTLVPAVLRLCVLCSHPHTPALACSMQQCLALMGLPILF